MNFEIKHDGIHHWLVVEKYSDEFEVANKVYPDVVDALGKKVVSLSTISDLQKFITAMTERESK